MGMNDIPGFASLWPARLCNLGSQLTLCRENQGSLSELSSESEILASLHHRLRRRHRGPLVHPETWRRRQQPSFARQPRCQTSHTLSMGCVLEKWSADFLWGWGLDPLLERRGPLSLFFEFLQWPCIGLLVFIIARFGGFVEAPFLFRDLFWGKASVVVGDNVSMLLPTCCLLSGPADCFRLRLA
ncbi:hypothetical protein F5X68DRAFT_65599 [Plectosphaerella plurivora]|uniref:Uncharacterized protein n=1 Tax=Plectosphaerella plurivora TaxID=936078 RepID=A0A9P8VFD9_9PEZI|nr:hypothetical protein F5X68DRAFT_65599 [Plectosphaerella plurivora]